MASSVMTSSMQMQAMKIDKNEPYGIKNLP
jgi:hypothetical protein